MIDGGNTGRAASSDPGWDFFVSYTAVDREWAEWISWQLEDAGYSVLVQAWDFVPGSNWHIRMQQGVKHARRTIAVLSTAYLTSVYGQAEWQAAHAADPHGFERKLLPIRIGDCPRPGFLGTVVSIDLFHHDAEKASRHLIDHVGHALTGRAKPTAPPAFPTLRAHPPTHEPVFPAEETGAAGMVAPATIRPAPKGQPAHYPGPNPASNTNYALVRTLTGHTDMVKTLSVLPLPDGRTLLASGARDRTVRLWDPATGRPGPTLAGHTKSVYALAVLPLPDGRTLLASGSADGTVRLWDPRNPGPIFTSHTHAVNALAALPLPDGRTLLASGGTDRTVRLWDPATTQLGPNIFGHPSSVNALAALPLPDGRTLLASASNDGMVRLWDPATTQLGRTLTGHTGWVYVLAALPLFDGRTFLASGGDDRAIHIWAPTET